MLKVSASTFVPSELVKKRKELENVLKKYKEIKEKEKKSKYFYISLFLSSSVEGDTIHPVIGNTSFFSFWSHPTNPTLYFIK